MFSKTGYHLKCQLSLLPMNKGVVGTKHRTIQQNKTQLSLASVYSIVST